MIGDSPLTDVDESDLNALVETQQREGPRLDFKRDNYKWHDEGTREFLGDVSAFANAHGGVLLIGIDEEDGCASHIPGVELDVDAEIQKMDAKIQTGIEPRIQGVEIRAIGLGSGRYVLGVRIPRSWRRPHMVIFKNLSRFFSRNSGGKYQLV